MKKILLTGITTAFIPLAVLANEYNTYNDCTKDNGTYFCDGYFYSKEQAINIPRYEQEATYPEYKQDSNIQGFFGITASITNVAWSEEVKDYVSPAELAETNFGLGAEAGFKVVDYNKIYNFGLTFNYDYLFDNTAVIPYPYSSLVSEMSTGFSAAALSFDNYILINSSKGKRKNIVLGLGYARATIRSSMISTYYGNLNGYNTISDSDNGSAIVLKFGLNGELTDKMDWNAGIRLFIPKNDSSIDLLTMGYLGFRRKF